MVDKINEEEPGSPELENAQEPQETAEKSAKKEKGWKKDSSKKKSKAEAKEKKVADKKAEETAQEQLLRLRADFDNFRKRTMRERTELSQRAQEELMEEILPVMDHLELAIAAADDHGADESFVDGVKMVAGQLSGVLGKFGLECIDAAESVFDHNLHEAISHLPSEDVPENSVVSQVRKGYKLGDKLIRAAQVVVSSGKPQAESAESEGE